MSACEQWVVLLPRLHTGSRAPQGPQGGPRGPENAAICLEYHRLQLGHGGPHPQGPSPVGVSVELLVISRAPSREPEAALFTSSIVRRLSLPYSGVRVKVAIVEEGDGEGRRLLAWGPSPPLHPQPWEAGSPGPCRAASHAVGSVTLLARLLTGHIPLLEPQ